MKPLVPYLILGLSLILFQLQITTCLRDNLLKALPYRSPHQEALSVFLLLPQCPVMHDFGNWEMVVPFAEAVCKMSDQSLRVLSKFDYFYITLSVLSIESHCFKQKLQQILYRRFQNIQMFKYMLCELSKRLTLSYYNHYYYRTKHV